MSLQISREKLENPELLDEYEIWYLWQRCQLPEGVEPPTEDPGSGRDEALAAKSKITPLEEQTSIVIGDRGGIVSDDDDDDEDGEEDYDAGWTQETRRAELARRGLNIHGNKAELVDRLLRSDNDELTEDDQEVIS